MVAEKVIAFRDEINSCIANAGVSFKDYVEDALQISQHDYNNLSVLKFHIESETGEDRDEALRFLNLLQDCYDGRSLNIAVISSLQDLMMGKDGNYTAHNTMRMLMQNAGISVGVVTEAWFEDDNFHQVTSSLVRNKDGSFSGKVTSYAELQNFLSLAVKRYGYAINPNRQRELGIKMAFMEEMDYSTPVIACIANIGSSVVKYTIFNEEFQIPSTEEPLLITDETEYKEVLYEVWVF